MSNRASIPRVGVGLPVYNGERYVGEAIESILAQTHTDFALVISDNASTDATEEICRAFAREDSRVRYERAPENLGSSPNFNRCLDLLPDTEFFKWSAHDDLLSETFLERCVEALDADPLCVLAFARSDYISADRQLIGRQMRSDLSLTANDAAVRARRFVEFTLEAPDIFWSYYGVMRRSALPDNPAGSYIASDQVLVLEMVLRGKLLQVPEARFIRRVHEAAWSSPVREGRNPRDDARRIDARASPRFVLPHFRLYRNYFRAVSRSPLSKAEKLRTKRALVYKVLREWRNPAGDIKYALGSFARRRRAAA